MIMIISDFLDIIGYLTANVLMLFAVVVAYSISNYEVRTERLLSKIAIGLVIGSIGIIILLNPFLYREGIMFDTRTVLLSLTAFYFSIETAIIASLITIGLRIRSEEHTSELQSRPHLVCRLLLEKKKKTIISLLYTHRKHPTLNMQTD